MPAEIRKVSKRYMKEPVEVTIGKVNATNKSIDHQYYLTSAQHRYETLKESLILILVFMGLFLPEPKRMHRMWHKD